MGILYYIIYASCCTLICCGYANAVMFYKTGDPTYNNSTPGDNSGWQFEGKFHSFLGVPIAPHYFITASHIGGEVGTPLDLHGDPYITIRFQDIPDTDLRVWEIEHSKPFPTYAPLSTGISEVGALATVFGRGTQRGADVLTAANQLRGWMWGPGDAVKRWGRNTITTISVGPLGQEYLRCHFDEIGVSEECHLSVGDSGGGLFVLQDGLWRLAGIHHSVDGPFRVNSSEPSFIGAIFDRDGIETLQGGIWTTVPEDALDVKSSFYSSRIAQALPWLASNVGAEVTSLASENFPAWRKLYFSPTEIADPTISDLLADPDADGIGNLLEFALHLDPTFHERAIMPSGVGLRGLPLAVSEDERLTIEYVRRTAISGAGLIYIPEFSTDLINWSAVGTESSTSINTRWDRVKITDAETTLTSPIRFGRLRVSLTP